MIRIMKPLAAVPAAVASLAASASAEIDFATYAPRLTAVKIARDEAPKIDGDLSDAAWSKAAIVEDFYQIEPVEGGAPSQRTRAYLMYDERTLYVGVRLFDTEPGRIQRSVLARDGQLRDEDAIRVMLDPYDTRRDGYFFATNANGAKVDALLENNSSIKVEWNALWDVDARVNEEGWIAEFAIPFQSISIDPAVDVWGLQILRTIRRTNEEVRWSNIDRTRDRIDLTNIGRLAGIEDVSSGRGVEAQLFATGATSYDWEMGDTDFTFDPSANIFYKVTPSLTASLTLNTSFADAPLDERQVNTGRFSLFFPETRDFFLQDAQAFEFGGRTATADINGLAFFSRNIGIVEGRPVDLIAGAKLSGKLGPANLGALVVRTGDDALYDGQYLGAARASFEVLGESKAGVIFTHGDPTGAFTNTLFGADFQYKNSTRFPGTLYADLAYVRTIDGDGATTVGDHYAAIAGAYRGDKWEWNAEFYNIGENYRPRLGFANRTGIRQYHANAFRLLRPETGPVRVLMGGVFGLAVTDLDDELLDRELGVFARVEGRAGDAAEAEVFRGFLDIREPFDIAGRLNVLVGEYRFTRYKLAAETSEGRVVGVGAEYEWGGLFGGDFRNLGAELSFRPSRHFRIEAEYELVQFDLPTGDLDVHVGVIESTIAVNPRMFIQTDIQYDNISESFTFLSRFSWEPRPEQEIFISLGHTALIEEDRFPDSFRAQGSSLALRLGHTFRM